MENAGETKNSLEASTSLPHSRPSRRTHALLATVMRFQGFLSKEANEVLSISAVICQEFEFECLRRIARSDADAII